MTLSTAVIAPYVQFFSGRQEAFLELGGQWRHATPEDAARMHTGFDRETRQPRVGVYIVPKGNGLLCMGFDLWHAPR